MITGIRTNMSSAQNLFNIKTDISTFGKAFANGMPIGFIAVSKTIEKKIRNKNASIYFGGTFSGNSMITYFAREYLIYLKKNKKKVFEYLEKISKNFENEINSFCIKNKIDTRVYRYFSMIRLVYSSKELQDRPSRDFFERKNEKRIKKFKSFIIKNGIYYPKNGILFFSFSTTKQNYNYVVKKFKEGLKRFL